jgi:hypothetical protein
MISALDRIFREVTATSTTVTSNAPAPARAGTRQAGCAYPRLESLSRTPQLPLVGQCILPARLWRETGERHPVRLPWSG